MLVGMLYGPDAFLGLRVIMMFSISRLVESNSANVLSEGFLR